jgi:ADP-heptose:LPS heptosyltransferase
MVTYDWMIEHLVYPTPLCGSTHFIQGMLNVVGNITGFCAKMSYDNLAVYQGREADVTLPEGYIIMPSAGKPMQVSCEIKEWGYENFVKLSEMLAEHYTVIQVGLKGDRELPAATKFFKHQSFEALAKLMRHCEFAVCLENGMSHLAGHMGKRAYTIYRPNAPAKPEHVMYPKQTPMTDEVLTPERVFEIIMEGEGRAKEEEKAAEETPKEEADEPPRKDIQVVI